MADERTAYDVLHVQPTAPAEVVHAAYRALARRHHPDGASPDVERMVQLNRAYEELKTADRRAAYDRNRRAVPVGPGRSMSMPAQGPLARRMGRHADDETTVDFGRYEGWRITDLARHDPEYLRWLSRHSTGVRYRAAIARHLPHDAAVDGRPSWAR